MDSLTTIHHRSDDPNSLLNDFQDVHDPELTAGVHQVDVSHPIDSALTIQSLKIAADTPKEDSSPITDSTRGPSLSASQDHNSDAASVHSMPAVLGPSPTSLITDRPSTTSSVTPSNQLQRAPLAVPSRTQAPQDDSSITQQQRRARHRSAIEVTNAPTFSLLCALTFHHPRFVHRTGYQDFLQVSYTDGIIYPMEHHKLSKSTVLLLQMPNRILTSHPVPLPLPLIGLLHLRLPYPLLVSMNLD